MRLRWLVIAAAGCGGASHGSPTSVEASMSRAADAQMVTVPGGRYVAGSTLEEREAAYADFRATSGHDYARAQQWFAREHDRHVAELPGFRIDLMPVTNAAYAEFVAAGGAPAPTMDAATWKAQGFQQDFASEVQRFVWTDGRAPAGREDHPVVLVTWDQAAAYCAWRGVAVGAARRLPTADELEKAARGENGDTYPWGNTYDPSKANNAVAGPRDTVPVGSFPSAPSPYGVLDLAGNVFEWTSTPWPEGTDPARARQREVKGSAWDDYGGVGRGASGHGRPRGARHAIVGFRCAADAEAR